MKKIFSIIAGVVSVFAFSQVQIGEGTVSPNTSVSLQFGTNGDARGLILPWNTTVAGSPAASYTANTTAVNGTMIFDLSDYKVKYKIPTGWFDLTVKNKADVVKDAIGNNITNNTVDSSIQDNKTELSSARTTIGTNTTDTADGILVLTNTDQAMILPQVNGYATVISPSAGTMVYDTANNMLCLYNGTVWSFWKP